ncbi:MAG: TonB-dependent receptor [Bacteroidetes bacterium]|nr:TonB-dependent receptor [Bacteroidota bacterium]
MNPNSMYRKISYFIWLLLLTLHANAQQKPRFTISGYVTEKGSGELLPGASIAIPALKTGTVTNNYGFFSLTVPSDSIELLVSYVGYAPRAFRFLLTADKTLDVELEDNKQLQEVVISAQKSYQKISEQTRMSTIEIPVHQIKEIPALLGEKDVLKVIQLLPGVQKGGEGNSGLYVRGGGPDQNLIILDDATVYNAFHLFGFFSLFNGDALKSVELTKGGFPARYGGRLSSVLEMQMKDGDKEEIHGEAGIGILSSRLVLEGPIIKKKSSFLVSGRRTYFDILTRPLMPAEGTVGYYFYDLNAKANYELDEKNRFFLSGYLGRDRFYLKSKDGAGNSNNAGISWGNATGTLRWNHLFNPRLFANTSLVFSNYDFGISAESEIDNSKFLLSYSSGIRDISIKYDLDYRPNPRHTIRSGVHLINHVFTPSAIVLKDDFSGLDQQKKNQISSFENAVYVEDDLKLGTRWKMNGGLRLSHFKAQTKNYFRAEPRLSVLYQLKSDLAAKGSFATMNQYIHMISNTGIGLPTDLWVPSSDVLKPQNSWQVAGGLAKDLVEKELLISVEGYYKESKNVIAYKEGASFVELEFDGSGNLQDNYNWEENITSGRGWSYGAEFLIQKKSGKFSGWIGYTLSWTQLQFDELNFGRKFYAKYDRRHDISLVGIWKIQEMKKEQNGVTLSGTWVYGTGNAITLPISDYNAPTHNPGRNAAEQFYNYNLVSQYTDRGAFRMAAYHRMDIGLQVTKQFEKYQRTFEFSVYNLYNRMNPFFYYIAYSNSFSGNSTRVLKQVSLFPLIPSVSYHIKF